MNLCLDRLTSIKRTPTICMSLGHFTLLLPRKHENKMMFQSPISTSQYSFECHFLMQYMNKGKQNYNVVMKVLLREIHAHYFQVPWLMLRSRISPSLGGLMELWAKAQHRRDGAGSGSAPTSFFLLGVACRGAPSTPMGWLWALREKSLTPAGSQTAAMPRLSWRCCL